MNSIIVSVLGYDRSGTTLVGKLLNNYRNVSYLGELDRGLIHYKRIRVKKNCGCGVLIKDCDVWQGVLEKSSFWDNTDKEMKMYEELGKFLNSDYLIDSSKIIGHIKKIQKTYSNHKVIHLIREPKGVIYSLLKSRKERVKKKTHPQPLIARLTYLMIIYDSLEWGYRNCQIERLKARDKAKNFLLINYENLNIDFEKKIIPFLEEDNSLEFDNVEPSHIIFGNKNRFTPVDLPIRVDNSYKKGLNSMQRFIVDVLTFPIRKIYKYQFN